ncbi:MAG: cell division protein ZapA [Synergistaceae bacterium]|jgi:hypothetical protein|nr:cell division protein ZapA [Synergistaceae bacterium]
MERTRSVSLLVGRKSYNLLTSMSEDRLRDIDDLLREVVPNTPPRMEQDERLFIACMTLASELTSVVARLNGILEEIEAQKEAELERAKRDRTRFR